MPKPYRKKFFCTLVSEDVEIALKYSFSLSREPRNKKFVQCNQLECQYVDFNQPPCPLSLDLFAEVIKKRGTNEDIEEWSPA